MNDRLAIELLHTERQLISTLGQLRLAVAFTAPQTWTMPMLRQRWPSLDEAAITHLAAERVGYQGSARDLVLSLDEVMAIDATITERLRAQRGTPNLKRVG